jgi:hypothetical protein
MHKVTLAWGLAILFVSAADLTAQSVRTPVDLPMGSRNNLPPTSFLAIAALEGPGSDIGVTVRSLRPEETAGQKMGHGVAVEKVAEDGPASRAGLKAGDMIFFNAPRGDVDEARAFARFVHDTPPGRVLPVAVIRNGVQIGIALIPELASAAGPSQEP